MMSIGDERWRSFWGVGVGVRAFDEEQPMQNEEFIIITKNKISEILLRNDFSSIISFSFFIFLYLSSRMIIILISQ